MSGVEVVDRGAREIVVFLTGDIGDETAQHMHAVVDEVARLEELSALNHAVVDMHAVTRLGQPGIAFLRELTQRGKKAGFSVSFSAMSGEAHRAVEAAGWTFVGHSPTT